MAEPSVQLKLRTYYAALPASSRRRLRELRDVILSAAPDAEDMFSYRIPGFRCNGRVLVYFAAWKEHTSVYPLTAGMREACARDLARFETSKGTVRFPDARPLPTAVIKRLVKARLRELRG